MMPPQPPMKLDGKKIGEILTSMKKQMGQVRGEISMMENDASSSLFQNFAGMINQVFAEKEQAQKRATELQVTLDKIYQGHPDIKISMEKKPDEKPKKKKP